MLLEINDLKMSYGPRAVLSIKSLFLYHGDKVAVVGRNGAGKTTLLRLIAGEIKPDGGRVILRGSLQMIPQSSGEPVACSGGEHSAANINKALAQTPDLLLADEPTTNLDLNHIISLEEDLIRFRGALLLVSHDRTLLERVCSKVLEIDDGICRLYNCHYAHYSAQTSLEKKSQEKQYDSYASEKRRLKRVAEEKARKSKKIKSAPKRMGNSEARLHKMGGQGAQEKLSRSAKAAGTRLEQLEPVQKPYHHKPIVFDFQPLAVHSSVLVSVNEASKQCNGKMLLDRCSFIVPNGKKTALIGRNGSGKTTLLNMIALRDKGINTCSRLNMGYLKQDLSGIDGSKSVLDNALAHTAYDECFVRTILSRLLFSRDMAHRKANTLSGGEKLKLALAELILGGYNLLIFDEPTNHLDMDSRSALESVLAAYPGAVLFVSHDRSFISAVADRIVWIHKKKTLTFEDGYEGFLQSTTGTT